MCTGRPRAGPTCRPLSTSTTRKVLYIMRGALERAVRWRHLGMNKAAMAIAPSPERTEPDPPSADEAAQLLNETWSDPEWGLLLWLIMLTGPRRGEISALRWRHIDFERGLLSITRSNAQPKAGLKEKHTKTGQVRKIALDALDALDAHTVELLTAHRRHLEQRLEDLGLVLSPDAFVFSIAPDGLTPYMPRAISQRYRKLALKLKLRNTRLHSLRHYSATELVAAGVDIRTVAGRLGHGSGGATTLKVYAGWVNEADRRAADTMATMVPKPLPAPAVPRGPYEVIAESLREQIRTGKLKPGDQLPTIAKLAVANTVAVGTAHRALTLLRNEGLVDFARGKRATVSAPDVDAGSDTPYVQAGSGRPCRARTSQRRWACSGRPIDYELKAVPSAKSRPWQTTRDGWMPHVRIPLEPDITAVVGANESGKTHLLVAIRIALTGDGHRQRDFCRSSTPFPVEQDSRLSPEIGVTLIFTANESILLEGAAGSSTDNGDALLLRPEPGSVDVINTHDERLGLMSEQAKVLQQLLPHAHELQTDLALPDSVSISALAHSEVLIASRRKRYEFWTLLSTIATEDDAAQQAPNILSLMEDQGSGGRQGGRPQGVPTLDDNFSKLLQHLADTLRIAREREIDERRDQRVSRIIKTFMTDYPGDCIRDRATVVFKQIDSAVDDTLSGDAVQAGTARMRRDFKLDSDPLKNVDRYAEFLEDLRNLRRQPRLKNQGILD